MKDKSFFTIPFEHIPVMTPLKYDLYVNSSSKPGRERFVKIYPKNEILDSPTLQTMRTKYIQMYLAETDRNSYLKSLVGEKEITDEAKTKVIKESAIKYLENVFESKKEFTEETLKETIEGCREVVDSLLGVIQDYNIQQLHEMIANLSFHDFYTYDHSVNVSMYMILIYKYMYPKASKEDITMAGLGGLLHDLGKLKLPTSIINNPGKLTSEEFEEIKKHPGYGKKMIEDNQFKCEGVDFEILIRIVSEHHENYDGNGYPGKIKGENIHEMARLTAIADFFDALTTKRSYHEKISKEDAVDIMAKEKGKKIDPRLFGIFTRFLDIITLGHKTNLAMHEDFDPCRPYDELPIELVKHIRGSSLFGTNENVDMKKDSTFGKVMTEEEKEAKKIKKNKK